MFLVFSIFAAILSSSLILDTQTFMESLKVANNRDWYHAFRWVRLRDAQYIPRTAVMPAQVGIPRLSGLKRDPSLRRGDARKWSLRKIKEPHQAKPFLSLLKNWTSFRLIKNGPAKAHSEFGQDRRLKQSPTAPLHKAIALCGRRFG